MKISNNEKFILKLLLNDPQTKNSTIADKLNITPQAVGKIRTQLISKGYIKNQEIILDYKKLGISVHAIALIKLLPKAQKFKANELHEVLQPVNAIRSYALPETDITHILIYAFKDVAEYDAYFRNLLNKFGDTLEIKHIYVFSSGSIIKSSPKNLFLDVLEKS
ncbi:MAG: Lrp/AsnC family transcriptional regulator [Candidatus Nanoarchaeia archaeon]